MAAFPGTLVADYHSYASITIPANTIRSSQTNISFRMEEDAFPSDMLDLDAKFTSGDFNGYRKGCMPDGRDLRFFSDSSLTTQLNHRVLYISLDNNPANSKLVVDVQFDMTTAAKTIYVAWGQYNTIDEEETDTYYMNWEFMQHGKWNDDDKIIDYTSNARDATPKSSTGPSRREPPTTTDYPYYYNVYDGMDDYCTIPSFDTGAYFTVVFRARFDGISSGWERIVSKKEAFSDTDGFEINRVDGTPTTIEVLGSDSTKVEYVLTNIDDGNWHTVAVAFFGTGVSCFLDGVKLTKSFGSTITSVANNTHQIGIGNNSNQTESNFGGDLADVWLITSNLADDQMELYTTMLNDPNSWTSKVTPSPGGAPSFGSRVAIDRYTEVSVVVDNVQRGNFTIADLATAGSDTITAVDLTKTILVATARNDSADCGDYMIALDLENTTTVKANREGNTGAVDIEYQAIEFSAGVKVERQRVVNMTTKELILTLTSDFDRNRSFIILSYENAGIVLSSDDRISAEFITPRKIRLLRQDSNTQTYVSVQAIQYDKCVVRAINADEDGNGTTEILDLDDYYPDFTDFSKVIMTGSVRNQFSNNWGGQDIWRMEVTDANSVTLTRWASSSTLNTVRLFTIEFTDATTVKQYLNTLTASGTTQSQTLSPTVNTGFSIAFPTSPELSSSAYPANTSTDDGGKFMFTTDLTSNSNVDQVREEAAIEDAYLGFWIVQFPGASSGGGLVNGGLVNSGLVNKGLIG